MNKKLTLCLFISIISFFAFNASSLERFTFIDEAKKDSSFLAFRKLLISAVNKKDKKFLLSIVDKNISNTLGAGDGKNEFIIQWELNTKDSFPFPKALHTLEGEGKRTLYPVGWSSDSLFSYIIYSKDRFDPAGDCEMGTRIGFYVFDVKENQHLYQKVESCWSYPYHSNLFKGYWIFFQPQIRSVLEKYETQQISEFVFKNSLVKFFEKGSEMKIEAPSFKAKTFSKAASSYQTIGILETIDPKYEIFLLSAFNGETNSWTLIGMEKE